MSSQPSESALVSDLRSGIPEAVTLWYKQYAPMLHRFILTKVESSHDCEEITRDTFMNCLRQLPLFKAQSSLKTWMCAIARHEIADYYRKRYAKKLIRATPLSPLLLDEPTADMHETSQQVVEILQHMRCEYKELLLLKYVDHRPVKEIARLLSRSIKAVETDLFRARKEFKDLYDTMNVHASSAEY